MSNSSNRFRRWYGSHPGHLLTMLAGFALLGYLVIVAGPSSLWKPDGAWWHSMALWLGCAFIAHDLILFPIYAVADRLLGIAGPWRHNYLRLPALGSGLLALIFFPGIIKQDASLYFADTGLTQQSFLGRWLLLSGALFGASAAVYAGRLCFHSFHRANSEPEK